MLATTAPRSTDLRAPDDSQELQFDTQGATVLMHMLSTFYHDGPASVLRELVSNAVDAVTAAGANEPVSVHVPTQDQYQGGDTDLVITDRGEGMLAAKIATVMGYGASTKKDDEFAIGHFGIGAKSPYAISSHFTIVSTHRGLRSEAVLTLTDQNRPQVGFVSRDVPCDGPDGTTMIVPIVSDSIRVRLFAAMARQLMTFPTGSLLINGVANRCVLDKAFWVDRWTAIVPNDDMPHSRSGRFVVMGGVSYSADQFIRSAGVSAAIFHVVPVGTLMPHPTRESLESTPANADYLRRYSASMPSSVITAVHNAVQVLPTIREAAVLLSKIDRLSSSYASSWRGQNVVPMLELASYNLQQEGRSGKTLKRPTAELRDVSIFPPDTDPTVVFVGEQDTRVIPSMASRTAAFMMSRQISKVVLVPSRSGSCGWFSWGAGTGVEPVDLSQVLATPRVAAPRSAVAPMYWIYTRGAYGDWASRMLSLGEVKAVVKNEGITTFALMGSGNVSYQVSVVKKMDPDGFMMIRMDRRVTKANHDAWVKRMGRASVRLTTLKELIEANAHGLDHAMAWLKIYNVSLLSPEARAELSISLDEPTLSRYFGDSPENTDLAREVVAANDGNNSSDVLAQYPATEAVLKSSISYNIPAPLFAAMVNLAIAHDKEHPCEQTT